jgi:hypothetical protein
MRRSRLPHIVKFILLDSAQILVLEVLAVDLGQTDDYDLGFQSVLKCCLLVFVLSSDCRSLGALSLLF